MNKKLTLDNIIALLDEENLFSYYYPLKIQKAKNIYISPFRHDSKAGSCHFNWYKGRFLFFDKSINKCYDVFEYLCFVNQISLYEALYKVNIDFRLNLIVDYSRISREDIADNILEEMDKDKLKYMYAAKENIKRDTDTRSTYKVVTEKRFSYKDIKYWNDYCIDERLLDKNNVKSIKEAYMYLSLKWKRIFKRSDGTLFFLYIIPPIFGEELSMKLYRPYSDKYKWSSSFSEDYLCHGYHNLDRNYDDLFICSSLKDSMVMQSLGYEACCPSSESASIDHRIISELKLKYKRVYILFDSDKAGVYNSFKYKQVYDIDNIVLTDTSGNKDLSDIIKNTSYQNLKDKIRYELKSKSNSKYDRQKLVSNIQ